jgi:hypothetical protein
MHLSRLLPDWSPQTWFDFVLCLATGIEACALWLLYRLERRLDERDTRVELPIRLYVTDFPDKEGNPTSGPQRLIEVMNCAAAAVFIDTVTLKMQVQNAQSAATNEKIGRLLKPYSTETINLVVPTQRVVRQALKDSVAKGDPGHAAYKAAVSVILTYRAYGKVSNTEPACIEGDIIWGEFHLR